MIGRSCYTSHAGVDVSLYMPLEPPEPLQGGLQIRCPILTTFLGTQLFVDQVSLYLFTEVAFTSKRLASNKHFILSKHGCFVSQTLSPHSSNGYATSSESSTFAKRKTRNWQTSNRRNNITRRRSFKDTTKKEKRVSLWRLKRASS